MRGPRNCALAALWLSAAACTPSGGGPDASGEIDPESLPPIIATAQLARGAIGTPYGDRLFASRGRPPYSWSLAAPAWLAVDPATGALRGVPPVAAGNLATVSVQVTDALGRAASIDLPLNLTSCAPGDWKGCLLPSSGQCLVGAQRCLPDGTWNGCDAGVPNTEPVGCGSSCSTCGPTADRCDGGVQCACGGGPSCPASMACCRAADGGAACTTLVDDIQSCGACGAACPVPPHTFPTCAGGLCGANCQPGFVACDGVRLDSNGCEADLSSDPNHCGTCPNACPGSPNGAPSCDAGTCDLICGPSTPQWCLWQDCRPYDVANCLGCGIPCTNPGLHAGAPVGCGGPTKCQYSCDPGWGDCNGSGDGCETNTISNPLNCGACGVNCFGLGYSTCNVNQCQ